MDELQALYEGAYARLVGVVGAICGSTPDAEEAVQEAFIRLIGQWDRVSTYDDPEAWLRKVALGKVSNRQRKVRNGFRALVRTGPPAPVAAPSGDPVDLRRALAALPLAQREALVLHHYVGLELTDIADQLDLPVGTVKSRMARGRAALAPLLREDVDHA